MWVALYISNGRCDHTYLTNGPYVVLVYYFSSILFSVYIEIICQCLWWWLCLAMLVSFKSPGRQLKMSTMSLTDLCRCVLFFPFTKAKPTTFVPQWQTSNHQKTRKVLLSCKVNWLFIRIEKWLNWQYQILCSTFIR